MVRFLTNPLSHTEQHSKWHYVDFPFDQDGAHGPQPVVQWDGHSEPINLLQAMDKMLAQLRDPQMPKDRKAIDLCWVEHLGGDIHQPLHATSWFSKEYPQGDQGGNLVLVRNGENVIIPLHTYWDDVEGLSLDPNNIRKAADRIEAVVAFLRLVDVEDHPAFEVPVAQHLEDGRKIDAATAQIVIDAGYAVLLFRRR